MKPTWINYICAHMFKVVTFGGASIFCFLILTHSCLSLDVLKSPDIIWLLPLILVIAFPLGCVLSSAILILFAPAIFWACAKINGAPFEKGDYIQILVGEYKGSSGFVSRIDDGRKVIYVNIVNSSDQVSMVYYSFNQVLKVKVPKKSEGLEQW